MVILLKKRKDSFFGIHFDFHALKGQKVGIIYKPEIVAKALDEIKPDFVQCDTKGHEGLSSYGTKVGNRAEICNDVLTMWRRLTSQRDIALYAHHSGLYDRTVAADHPDWAMWDENGVPSDAFISAFSPYAEEILIPQLLELAGEYGLNGAWIDGECWAAFVDYSPFAVAKWKEKNHCEPPKRGDADYECYREFCRQGFRDYTARYISAVKEKYPDFEITSNWFYSAYMPEKAVVPLDFISGDYNSEQSVASARICGRAVASRGKVWDLVAWGQHARPGGWMTRNRSTKEYVQYCQEAAEILSLGGAFVFFNIMYGFGGVVQEWMILTWKKVGEFVRAYEPYCFGAKSVPEIAVILTEEKTEEETNALFHQKYASFEGARGWVNAIQDSQHFSEIVMTADFENKDLSAFPLIVLPASTKLTESAVNALKRYVKNGGKLIVDAKSVNFFSDISGVSSRSSSDELIFLSACDRLAALETEVAELDANGGKVCGLYYPDNHYTEQMGTPAAFVNDYGSGKIISLAFDFGLAYNQNKTPVIRRFMKNLFNTLNYSPKVQISGSGFVDATLMKKDGRLMLNLINYAGTHNDTDYRTYDEIPPIGPLNIKIKSDKVSKIILQPENKNLNFKLTDGYAEFNLEKLEIYSIIEIVEE